MRLGLARNLVGFDVDGKQYGPLAQGNVAPRLSPGRSPDNHRVHFQICPGCPGSRVA